MSRRERENIVQVLAREYRMVDETFKRDDEENSPNYVRLPSGDRANRVFLTGTVTEVEERASSVKLRVNDGSGNFLMYPTDDYSPEVAEEVRELEVPEFVAVVGKTGVYNPEEGTYISTISPEFVKVVSKSTRNKGVVEAARKTLDRLEEPGEDSEQEEVREGVVDALENIRG